jgi:DNA-binding IclR family transcriptional regulator
MNVPGDRRGTIQSVDRAARILKALGSGASRAGVTELAERLGLAKGTVYGLLRTLGQQGLVEQDPETGKYRLGAAMLQLGNAFLDNHELRGRSLLWADSLASRIGESVRVGVMNGPTVLIVHHVFRPDNSVQILEVGASIPWHACALGKAIVAYVEPAERAVLLGGPLPTLTGRTLTDPRELSAVLLDVVASGIALEDQEAIVGEAEIAAPVFDHRGLPVGAIMVRRPGGREGTLRHALVAGESRRASCEPIARRRGVVDCPWPACRLQRNAVDRAGRHAQFASRAQRREDRVHALLRADDRIDRTGLDAERATDALRLVDERNQQGSFLAACGIDRFCGPSRQCGQHDHDRLAAGRTAVDVGRARGHCLSVRPACGEAAPCALRLRQRRVDAIGKG